MSPVMEQVQQWDSIANPPRSRVRAAVARWLLKRMAAHVQVKVMLPDGSMVGPRDEGLPVLEILSDRFFDRLGVDLKIGLGESFMAGEWRPGPGHDLADVLTPYAERLLDIVPAWMRRFRRWVEPTHPAAEENHKEGARSNIARHYDLSNDLFSNFLDSTMTYSAADFGGERPGFDALADAQRRKIERVLDFAGVRSGMRILEIGTGWGQLALQAAQRGAFVHTITLSQEQAALAQERIDKAGLTDRVQIELRDYRDVEGQYDAIVSVEMIEAVGEKYWATYFDTVSKHLKPGGRFGLQAITMPHDRMLASRHAYTWISKYIFPGGLIPSLDAIAHHAHDMHIVDRHSLGLEYAHTLKLWRERFNQNQATIRALGFDETFDKMWQFYLAYSEAGFRARHLDVWQLGLQKAS